MRRRPVTKPVTRDERLLDEARQLRELAGFLRPQMSQALMQRARPGEAAALPRGIAAPSIGRSAR